MFSRIIREGYHILSLANTARIVSSGNPERILRHVLRKRMLKEASKIGRKKAKRNSWRRI